MSNQKAPNFLIVGVTKCGTTFLAKALSVHPEIFVCKPKEPFFFNAPDLTENHYQWYLDTYFAPAGDQPWRGEGSTNYFHNEHAIGFIEKFLGTDVRIIVCLRHPIGRMLSHYLHDYKKSRLTGKETLADEVFTGYILRSMYSERLTLWKSRFPNLQVQFFDDLVVNGVDYYTQASNFLGITPPQFKSRPVNEGLQMGWDGDFLSPNAEPPDGTVLPRFPREELDDLGRQFIPDIERIMELTGRDLTNWFDLPKFTDD